MKTRPGRARTGAREVGLDREALLGIYRNMVLSRRIDDRQIQLKRQNQIFFQIAGAGHEAVQTAAGMVLKPGHDWFYAYYRDMALMLRLGMTPKEIQMEALGCADDPSSGGRQMPSHWGHPRLNVVSRSSVTGTQYLQAVGCSHAGRYISIVEECRKRGLRHQTDEITYVSGGEGSTSEGEFWEALNTACNLKLPILFLIEDNKYAISVPVEVQTAGGTIGALVKDWPNLRYEELDGCDPLECYRVLSDVVAGMRRRREGPALVQAHVVRPYSHSLSDDERLYKPERERQEEARKDPIIRFEKHLLREG
ncbi:MAG: thiamine pyrophosphate-dependent dehydrogenase E1 component subunit alpha, partial [Gemmatimonadales bacterium]